MTYVCDHNRHLICVPYSVPGLHAMARDLGIDRCWFHNKPGRQHYDIPKRRISEIMATCYVVSTADLLQIIKNAGIAPMQ